jgi:hypothetical protein
LIPFEVGAYNTNILLPAAKWIKLWGQLPSIVIE